MRKALFAAAFYASAAIGALAQLQPFTISSYTVSPMTASSGSLSTTLTGAQSVLLQNVGANVVYCAPGATATTSALQLSANGGQQLFALNGATQITCNFSAGSATVNVFPGIGYSAGVGAGTGTGGTVSVSNVNPNGITAQGSSSPVAQAYWTPNGGAQHNLSIASATTLTVPANSVYATVCAVTAQVKYTTDGSTTPTAGVGMTLASGACVALLGPTVLSNFKAISATGTLDVEYFK